MQVGQRTPFEAEIPGGLKEHEQIILHPSNEISEAMRVEPVILYMTPREDHFLVSFALGEKAVAAGHGHKLPRSVMKAIESAPKYAEGRRVRLEVRHVREVSALATLAEIKDEH